MNLPIRIISTDFDGTLHSEAEYPPVPLLLQERIGALQRQGVVWVINTGRDLASLTEGLGKAGLSVRPDFVVTVEREIHRRRDGVFKGLADWNRACDTAHQVVFERIKPQLPEAVAWIRSRFEATVYEDAYSPFCLIARSLEDAEVIHGYLDTFCARVANLTVVRNDVYARLSHRAFNKGTALGEIARVLGVDREQVFAAGDHLNDLPMLSDRHARWLVAPANAIDRVKAAVRAQRGYVSREPFGKGVLAGLEHVLRSGGGVWGGV